LFQCSFYVSKWVHFGFPLNNQINFSIRLPKTNPIQSSDAIKAQKNDGNPISVLILDNALMIMANEYMKQNTRKIVFRISKIIR